MHRWSVPVGDQVISSDLLRTELLRVTRRVDPEQLPQARALLDSLVLLSLSTSVCERAAVLEPEILRSLDALHLAAALELGDDLEGHGHLRPPHGRGRTSTGNPDRHSDIGISLGADEAAPTPEGSESLGRAGGS